MKKKNRTLHPKVASIGLGGALTTLIVALLSAVDIYLLPHEVAALGVVVSGVVAWLAPEREDQIQLDRYRAERE